MDSVSHPTNVVMETGSVLMAVMNSTAVSTRLLTFPLLPPHPTKVSISACSNTPSLLLLILQHVPVLNGRAVIDSVFHHPGAVMEAQTALIAVMNSTAVSTGLLACMFTFLQQ